jgi:hypothetical protein
MGAYSNGCRCRACCKQELRRVDSRLAEVLKRSKSRFATATERRGIRLKQSTLEARRGEVVDQFAAAVRRTATSSAGERAEHARFEPDGSKTTDGSHQAVAVYSCPICGARVGEPCKDKGSGRKMGSPHGRRTEKLGRPQGKAKYGSIHTVSGGGFETNRRRH